MALLAFAPCIRRVLYNLSQNRPEHYKVTIELNVFGASSSDFGTL